MGCLHCLVVSKLWPSRLRAVGKHLRFVGQRISDDSCASGSWIKIYLNQCLESIIRMIDYGMCS